MIRVSKVLIAHDGRTEAAEDRRLAECQTASRKQREATGNSVWFLKSQSPVSVYASMGKAKPLKPTQTAPPAGDQVSGCMRINPPY